MKLLTKIYLGLLLIILISSSAMIFFSNKAIENRFAQDLKNSSILKIKKMERDLSKAFSGNRETVILNHLQEIKSKTDAEYAAALNTKGIYIAHTNVIKKGRESTLFKKEKVKSEALCRFETYQDGQPYLKLLIPLSSSSQSELIGGMDSPVNYGFIELSINMSKINESTTDLTKRILLITICFSMLILSAAYLYLKKNLSQINHLIKGTKEVKSGTYGSILPVLSKDELGELTENFNEMSRKLSETAVSREYLSSIIENMRDPLIICDKAGTIKNVNKAGQNIFTVKKEELYGKNVCELCKHASYNFDSLVNDIEKKGHFLIHEIYLFSKNSTPVPMSLYAFYANNAGEKSIIVVLKDLREIKKHLMELQKVQENFKLLIENAPFGVLISRNGEFIYANETANKILASEGETVSGKKISDFAAESEKDFLLSTLEKVENKKIKTAGIESKLINREGSLFEAIISCVKIEWEGKDCALTFFYDITEKKREEMEILNAQKTESLQIMAGGISHDFNNMLSGIIGNLSILEKKISDPATKEIVSEIFLAAESAQNLTRQLLAFSKEIKPIKKLVNSAKMIREAAVFSTRGSSCEIIFSISPDLKNIIADENQITQAINNIMINAVQAMPDGGRIFVKAQNIKVEEDGVSLQAGDYILVSISDEGIGIPKEYIGKIFQPYFTTKPKGHGLGLPMVYAAIKNHQGRIDVSSQTGKGTTFNIYLPSTDEKIAGDEVTMDKRISLRGKRVLVMDDDEIVRKSLGRMLDALGIKAVFTNDGENALKEYSLAIEQKNPFDLIISDLTVPGKMGGTELAGRILKINPAAKIIVSSGYSDEISGADYEKYGFCAMLAKPYRIEQLEKTLISFLN